MPQTVTTFDAALKDFYLPHAIKVLNNKTRTWKWMPTAEGEVSGRQIITYAHTGRSGSFGFMPAGATQPTSGNEVRRQIAIPFRQLWGFVRFNEDVVAQSRNGRGAWEKAAGSEMKAMTKNLVRQAEVACWGIGNAFLAQIRLTANSATQTLRTITTAAGTGFGANNGTRYLQPNMYVDVLQGTTSTAFRSQGRQVLSVNTAAGTVTFDAAVNATAGDTIVWTYPNNTDSSDDAPMGIPGLFDDGTYVGTIHGIDRSQNDDRQNFRANVINAGTDNVTTGALSIDMVQRAEDLADENGDGEAVAWWGHHSVRREYLKECQKDRRYTSPYAYDPGIKEDLSEGGRKTGLTHNEIPFMVARDAPYQTLFCAPRGGVGKYIVSDLHWVEANGNVLYLRNGVAGQFEGQCTIEYNCSFKDEAPNSASVIRFITSTVDAVPYV